VPTASRKKTHKRSGTLYVISAPSGAGKTTLSRMLLKKVSGLKHSVSYTTRAPRKGEVNDVHYTFITEKKFKGMIARGEFAEWAMVHGNLYGTSANRLKKIKSEGYDIILDIDTRGAMQLKKSCKDAVFIFILPPSMQALKKRLVGRGTDAADIVARRLENAKGEMAGCRDYDYIVVNDRLEKACNGLESIITAVRLRTEHADNKLINNFLK